jgi:hypothetical protein
MDSKDTKNTPKHTIGVLEKVKDILIVAFVGATMVAARIFVPDAALGIRWANETGVLGDGKD